MLMLSRKANESLQIGESITLKVIEIRGGVVRLAIEAPREIAIARAELLPRVQPTEGGDNEGT